MKRIRSLALLLFAILPAAHAGEATDTLHAFFREVRSLRAEFAQELYERRSGHIQRSTGTVAIQRPGRFRWDYLDPYRQEIVADGEKLWFFDTDLEQVTVKPLEEGLGGTPAFLLTSDEALEARFVIEELPTDAAGRLWVALAPLDKESNFERIRLAFVEGELARMEIVDGFGQTTRLSFTAVERNPVLDPALFHFTPPPGVDVLGAGGE